VQEFPFSRVAIAGVVVKFVLVCGAEIASGAKAFLWAYAARTENVATADYSLY
jgi:hypothetical protein